MAKSEVARYCWLYLSKLYDLLELFDTDRVNEEQIGLKILSLDFILDKKDIFNFPYID